MNKSIEIVLLFQHQATNLGFHLEIIIEIKFPIARTIKMIILKCRQNEKDFLRCRINLFKLPNFRGFSTLKIISGKKTFKEIHCRKNNHLVNGVGKKRDGPLKPIHFE